MAGPAERGGMGMRRQLAVIALVFSLGACASGQTLQMPAGKAMLVSEIAVDGANKAAKQAADANTCTGPCAVKLKAAIVKANTALDAAHTAYRAGQVVAA